MAPLADSALVFTTAACGIVGLIQERRLPASGASPVVRTKPAEGTPNATDCTSVELSHGTCSPLVCS